MKSEQKMKKGQMAIFMIIALVLLIGTISFFIFRGEKIDAPLEEQAASFEPENEVQKQLKAYVDACLQEQVLQGLEIMRLQGGYIDVPEDADILIVKDKNNLQVKEIGGIKRVVTDSNGLGNMVPYWILKDRIDIPTLPLMEGQLEGYLKQGMEKCISNFEPFRQQGFEVSYGSTAVQVEISNAANAKISLPVELSKEGIKYNAEEFVYTAPIDLLQVRDIAESLSISESLDKYLELHSKNLLALYTGVGEGRFPPFFNSVTNLDCSSVIWSKLEIKSGLQRLLQRFIPEVKIKNTLFTQDINSGLNTSPIYGSFVYDLLVENHTDTKIGFSYRPEWDFLSYDIRPSQGDTIRPGKFSIKIPHTPRMCVFEYESKYTVDAPILVEINSTASAKISPDESVLLDKNGYKFQFAMDMFLCGNQERECTGRLTPGLNISLPADSGIEQLSPSMFCNEEQKTGGPVVITITNASNNMPLDRVSIHYSCGSVNTDCFVGETDSEGKFSGGFPRCVNGFLYALKGGYSQKMQPLTVMDSPEYFSLSLEPIHEVEVSMKKVDVASYLRQYHETGSLDISGSVKDFEGGEKAMMSITGLQDDISYFYPDDGNDKIKIGAGSHSLDITLSGNVSLRDTQLEGRTVPGYEGDFSLGSLKIGWTPASIGNKATFYTFSEIEPDFSGTWFDIDDSMIREDGSLSAELLYSCSRNPETDACIYSQCSFVAIDGNHAQDFSAAPESCQKVENVRITKEQYEGYMQPSFTG